MSPSTCVALVVLAIAYFSPTLVAICRGTSGIGRIIAVNLFLGWTCGFWALALFWACYRPVLDAGTLPLEAGPGIRIEPRLTWRYEEGREQTG